MQNNQSKNKIYAIYSMPHKYIKSAVYKIRTNSKLNEQTLNLVLHLLDLVLELGSIIAGYRCSNDRARHSTSTSKSSLGGDENVGDVLILAQQRQTENNLDGAGVSSHDDKLRDTSVEGLGGLVSSLLELAQMGSLLDNIQDLLGHSRVSEGKGTGVDGSHFDCLFWCLVDDNKGSLQ